MESAEYLEENSEARRVGNFLDWAYEKLNKELCQIEAMEAEFGTAEWSETYTHYRNGTTARSHKEKRRIIKEVDDLRRSGCSLRTAAKLCGIGSTTYHDYRKECGLKNFKKGVKGTRPKRKSRDAGSTPATSTLTNNQ